MIWIDFLFEKNYENRILFAVIRIIYLILSKNYFLIPISN